MQKIIRLTYKISFSLALLFIVLTLGLGFFVAAPGVSIAALFVLVIPAILLIIVGLILLVTYKIIYGKKFNELNTVDQNNTSKAFFSEISIVLIIVMVIFTCLVIFLT